MQKKELKLAIISDLHCHPKRTTAGEKDETYLLTDKLRTPSNDHPVNDLLEKIKKGDIKKVDLTLCPGDFTDKANIQGFISGWGFSLEIHRALKSNEIIATVGNHDVDVYGQSSNYNLDIAKGIKRGFPVEDQTEQDTFWSRGCVFLERETFRILLINSSHFHYNRENSKNGKVDAGLIEYVEDYLSRCEDDKIQLAISHHHPIDHSVLQLGEADKIENSDALLNVLGKYKFDLFIHGHKHHPLIRYHYTTQYNHRIPVFSSGSFSSYSNLMFTSARNTFHLISLQKTDKCNGEIETWTFFPNSGWSQPEDESGFPTYTGFGNEKKIEDLVEEISNFSSTSSIVEWSDLLNAIPNLAFLLPDEASLLQKNLSIKNIQIDKPLRAKPNRLFNLSKF